MRFLIRCLSIVLLFLVSPSQASDSPPLKVCVVSGSFEYKSDESLKPFSEFLEKSYNAKVTFLSANGDWENLPGLEALDSCDVAVFFTRRLRITGEQLEQVKRYCLSGKPIVALRTASHGFQNFLEFDKEVLGGNYANHYGGEITQQVSVVPEAKDHPILQGVGDFQSPSSLYRTSPLAPDCTVLMMGSIPNEKPEPCVWTRTYKGGHVVYIGLGKDTDFEIDSFRRLLVNSLFWAANREVEQPSTPASHAEVQEAIDSPSLRLQDLTSEWETPPVRCLWNFFNLYNPKVIHDSGSDYPFKMWLFGWATEEESGADSVFFARSKNLTQWEVYSGEQGWDATMNPRLWKTVLKAGKERYDSIHNGDPSVVLKDGVYYMAFSSVGFDFVKVPLPPAPSPKEEGGGTPLPQGEGETERIYVISCVMGATSTDGIHWTKSPEPILIWKDEYTNRWALVDGKIAPPPAEYYGSYHRPSLLFDEGRWRLWFDYFHPGTFVSLGIAENQGDFLKASDWKVLCAEKEPLIKDWPNPSVIKAGSKYLAFSDAPGYPPEMGGDQRQTSLAESPDGIDWKVLGHIRPEGKASSHVPEPFVIERDGARWLYLFYSWKPERKDGEPWDYRYKEIRFIRKRL